jgi:hypothetical protein
MEQKEMVKRRILDALGRDVGGETAAALSARAASLVAAGGVDPAAPPPAPAEDFAAALAGLAADD